MKIEEGYRVGKLTVETDTGKRKNGYTVWNCRCDCGGMRGLDTRALQRGKILDCGCEKKVKPGQCDLTGQRFGKLTALEPTKDRDQNGVTVWRCRCDCGNEAMVSASLLKNGYKKSCGCIRHRSEDLTGQRFGSLVVVGVAEKKERNLYWRCICDCGNETVVRQAYLKEGRTKSCGCLQSRQVLDNMKYVDGTSVRMLENAPNRLNRSNTSGHNGIYFNKKKS